MKRTMLGLMTLGLLFSGQAMAEDSTGCGLGTMIFDGKSGVAPQVLAVTTNGTLGNQTFGISSGTLGCDQDATVTSSEKLGLFMKDNMESLAQNMAVGEGESLETLAELMSVEQADRAAFYAATKAHFVAIYTHEDITAEELLVNLDAVLRGNEKLRQYAS